MDNHSKGLGVWRARLVAILYLIFRWFNYIVMAGTPILKNRKIVEPAVNNSLA
jgi:hypothetical protein